MLLLSDYLEHQNKIHEHPLLVFFAENIRHCPFLVNVVNLQSLLIRHVLMLSTGSQRLMGSIKLHHVVMLTRLTIRAATKLSVSSSSS